MTINGNEVIRNDLILLQQDFTSKEEVLDCLISQAQKIGLITDKEKFAVAVYSREAEVPTAIGYQIAIPHGKSTVVIKPFIGFVQTKKEFLWSDKKEDQVRLIFLIGVPEANENNIHLKFISQLSKKLLDDDFRETLLSETKINEVYRLLRSIDVQMK